MSIEFYTRVRKESVQRELREQKETERVENLSEYILHNIKKALRRGMGNADDCLCGDRQPAETREERFLELLSVYLKALSEL